MFGMRASYDRRISSWRALIKYWRALISMLKSGEFLTRGVMC